MTAPLLVFHVTTRSRPDSIDAMSERSGSPPRANAALPKGRSSKKRSPDSPRTDAITSASLTSPRPETRSEEHTSELQSLMRISYAVFCLKKKKNHKQ